MKKLIKSLNVRKSDARIKEKLYVDDLYGKI